MKGPSLTDQFGEDESEVDDQITKVLVDALSTNDKVIEIRPAEQSKRMGLKKLLLLGAGAIGVTYWIRNSQKPGDFVEDAKEMAAERVHQAAEAIEAGSEAASERIETGSERAGAAVQEAGDTVQEAGDAVQEASEKAAKETEQAGEKAAKETEEAGETAADQVEEAADEEEEDKTFTSASNSSDD